MKMRQRDHRWERRTSPSLEWFAQRSPGDEPSRSNVAIDAGWGKLIFAHTFGDNEAIARAIRDEAPGQRNIALYIREPQVVLSQAPQELFLDPSHTFRLYFSDLKGEAIHTRGFRVRRLYRRQDIKAVNRVLKARGMVPFEEQTLERQKGSKAFSYLVAEDTRDNTLLGVVMGVDHVQAFDDPERGSSLWCLAVAPDCTVSGVGRALVTQLAGHYAARGRAFMDLSVMHDNDDAIALYEGMGFKRVPVFCIKKKNTINESLYIAPPPEESLNPYATIIVREARRRGIAVEVLDIEQGYFRLTLGGRSIVCRESLSELTTAIAMSRCDDKRTTRRILDQAGLSVPEQISAETTEAAHAFLEKHGRVAVKPARGEQGNGVVVNISDPAELDRAVEAAGKLCDVVLLERHVSGQDLRIIVIDFEVVAAAVRKPPRVTGNGRDPLRKLIERQSRRRESSTGGESRIPMDDATAACVAAQGFELDSVLPAGREIVVRDNANLHTGGTIHDVTQALHPGLVDAAESAARALDIPVTGLDFLVESPERPQYCIIEANERPGLANHEPAPTAERFIDFLFPQTTT